MDYGGLQVKGNVVHALVGKDYDAFWQALGASPSAAAGYMLACAQAILDAACSAARSTLGVPVWTLSRTLKSTYQGGVLLY